jgi:hypothetical protein
MQVKTPHELQNTLISGSYREQTSFAHAQIALEHPSFAQRYHVGDNDHGGSRDASAAKALNR